MRENVRKISLQLPTKDKHNRFGAIKLGAVL